MIDLFTRFVVAVALPDMKAETTVLAFEKNWILSYGPPAQVHSDQGANFESNHFQTLLRLWRIYKTRTTPYHPKVMVHVSERIALSSLI